MARRKYRAKDVRRRPRPVAHIIGGSSASFCDELPQIAGGRGGFSFPLCLRQPSAPTRQGWSPFFFKVLKGQKQAKFLTVSSTVQPEAVYLDVIWVGQRRRCAFKIGVATFVTNLCKVFDAICPQRYIRTFYDLQCFFRLGTVHHFIRFSTPRWAGPFNKIHHLFSSFVKSFSRSIKTALMQQLNK